MFRHKKTLKAIVLSLGLAAMTLPSGAQVVNHGKQQPGDEHETSGGLFMHRSQGGYTVGTEQFGNGTTGAYQVGTQQFGNPVPLGGGLIIMAAAGAAYALKKRKKNN